jgi:hypothetical protein
MINNSNENVLMDDANSPDINRKILGIVSSDFIKVSDTIKEASYQIRQRGFSEHPIFVVARQLIEIGALLLPATETLNQYHYYASFLDEFVQRTLVGEESIDLFKENYKNPDEFCCLFVMDEDFAGFIFMPYPED